MRFEDDLIHFCCLSIFEHNDENILAQCFKYWFDLNYDKLINLVPAWFSLTNTYDDHLMTSSDCVHMR